MPQSQQSGPAFHWVSTPPIKTPAATFVKLPLLRVGKHVSLSWNDSCRVIGLGSSLGVEVPLLPFPSRLMALSLPAEKLRVWSVNPWGDRPLLVALFKAIRSNLCANLSASQSRHPVEVKTSCGGGGGGGRMKGGTSSWVLGGNISFTLDPMERFGVLISSGGGGGWGNWNEKQVLETWSEIEKVSRRPVPLIPMIRATIIAPKLKELFGGQVMAQCWVSRGWLRNDTNRLRSILGGTSSVMDWKCRNLNVSNRRRWMTSSATSKICKWLPRLFPTWFTRS